jgi:hypothetical protein
VRTNGGIPLLKDEMEIAVVFLNKPGYGKIWGSNQVMIVARKQRKPRGRKKGQSNEDEENCEEMHRWLEESLARIGIYRYTNFFTAWSEDKHPCRSVTQWDKIFESLFMHLGQRGNDTYHWHGAWYGLRCSERCQVNLQSWDYPHELDTSSLLF